MQRLSLVSINVTGTESTWLRNNLNERGRLAEALARGLYNETTGAEGL